VPALRDFPEEYIHQPWTAPYDDQVKANCIIGENYPDRMINHVEARQACIEKLREFHKELVHPSKLICMSYNTVKGAELLVAGHSTVPR
jgi:hypothetical protein